MSARNHLRLRSGLSLAAFVVLSWASAVPAIGQAAFPARLDAYFTKVVRLTGEERKVLLAGAPLAKNLEPLLLDRSGASSVGPRSVAWTRLLVRQCQSQSLGRSDWVRRTNHQREGAGGRTEGARICPERCQEKTGELTGQDAALIYPLQVYLLIVYLY